MGIEAAKKVLRSSKLEGKNIDMILFSSQFPEYTTPSQALITHNALNGKEDCLCLDTNACCVGMLATIENTTRAMLSNPYVTRALIIGSDYASIHSKKDDEMTYPLVGDAACAIILEKVKDENCGFVDSLCKTNGAQWNLVKYPSCGLSKIYKGNVTVEDIKMSVIPFNGLFSIDYAVTSIYTLLERNNLKMDDINSYCFSQFTKQFQKTASEKLNVDINKFIVTGDKYGYTGTTSPFIALYEGIKSKQIKRGDLVCLWSVGTHWTICTMLIRY